MVLLHLFKEAATTLNAQVAAAHFDHGMRATSADDAAWLANVCKSWGIPLHQGRSEVVLRGEAAARDARYQFLTDVARRSSANRIATAHHADDQVETVLFRLLRGTGMRGLAGIPVRRGVFIRPLIRFSKDELRRYAEAKKLQFRDDETNALDIYARNRIRHQLLPALRVVQPRIMESVLSLSRHAARSERAHGIVLREVLSRVVLPGKKREIEIARGTLLEYDAEIRARVLRTILRRFGAVP